MLLNYRVPREPSTPRIAIWRKLKRLGVLQIGDGLVALPQNARTKEHLEWIAGQVREAQGEAVVWSATPTTRRQSVELEKRLRAERDQEYADLIDQIQSQSDVNSVTVERWRREWQRINRRDHLGAERRDTARRAIDTAAESAHSVSEQHS